MTNQEFQKLNSYMKYIDYMFKEKTPEELSIYKSWLAERNQKELSRLELEIPKYKDGLYALKTFGIYWIDLIPVYIKKAKDGDEEAKRLIYSCVNYSYHN